MLATKFRKRTGNKALFEEERNNKLTLKIYQFIGESNIYFAAMASVLLVFPPLILLWLNRRFVFNASGQ